MGLDPNTSCSSGVVAYVTSPVDPRSGAPSRAATPVNGWNGAGGGGGGAGGGGSRSASPFFNGENYLDPDEPGPLERSTGEKERKGGEERGEARMERRRKG